jgi:hypothetical protein
VRERCGNRGGREDIAMRESNRARKRREELERIDAEDAELEEDLFEGLDAEDAEAIKAWAPPFIKRPPGWFRFRVGRLKLFFTWNRRPRHLRRKPILVRKEWAYTLRGERGALMKEFLMCDCCGREVEWNGSVPRASVLIHAELIFAYLELPHYTRYTCDIWVCSDECDGKMRDMTREERARFLHRTGMVL